MIRMLIVGYRFRHPLGAAIVRGSSLEPCLSLVLPGSGSMARCPDDSIFWKNPHGRFRASDLFA
jgi:hypothetical protein